MGNGIATNQLMKMVAAGVQPGKPVANLYVSCFVDLSLPLILIVVSFQCGVMTLYQPLSDWPET